MRNPIFSHPFKTILCVLIDSTSRRLVKENIQQLCVVYKLQFNLVAIRLMQRFV